jgi:hypothetical protein
MKGKSVKQNLDLFETTKRRTGYFLHVLKM